MASTFGVESEKIWKIGPLQNAVALWEQEVTHEKAVAFVCLHPVQHVFSRLSSPLIVRGWRKFLEHLVESLLNFLLVLLRFITEGVAGAAQP